MIHSVCVFCSSSDSVNAVYKETATDLGRRLGRLGLNLIYGGASIGLMGCLARGVHEFGGRVTGVLPEFFKIKEIEYGDADELIVTRDMRERKAVMDQKSDAFITLPGGIGTMEESMEILSMKQLNLTPKPLVFVNTCNFFDGLISNLQEMVDLKFAKKETLDLFAVEPGPQEALDYILNYKPPKISNKWMYPA